MAQTPATGRVSNKAAHPPHPDEPPAETFGDGVFCPCCSYHLRGIPEAQCPECGFAYDHRAIGWAARGAAHDQDRAVRGAIRAAVLACALSLSDAVNPHWPSMPVQLVCVLIALLLALAIFWHYEDLTPPSPWQSFWKIMAFLCCFDVTLIVVAFPAVGCWAGLISCFFAWVAWFGYSSPYQEALSAIDAADRSWIQHNMRVALGFLALSSGMVVLAWR